MTKSDIRNTMTALSQLPLSDKEVLSFISNLADYQHFKTQKSYCTFCTNCAIAFTSCAFTLQDKYDSGLRDAETDVWCNNFIKEASELKVVYL